MESVKVNKEHLEKMAKDEKFIALQAHLLRSAMEWMAERSKDSKPLTKEEQELGDTALTLVDEVKRLVNAS